MSPRLDCAAALPCAAPRRYHRTASAASLGTPSPLSYLTPRFELRVGVTLLGAEAVPPHRLGVVLGHARAVGVHDPEVELRGGVTLLGGEAVPPHRLGGVLGHTLAVGVHEPEVGLRGGVTLLGVVLKSSKGGGIVASHICL